MKNYEQRQQLHRVAVIATFISVMALGLGACSTVRETIGIDTESPDEFQVMVRPPLSMPKDLGLKAPRPGAKRPQATLLRDRTKQIVLDSGGDASAKKVKRSEIKGVTKAEAALLHKLGADGIDPNIRHVVERETAAIETEGKSFVDGLLFWKDKKLPGKVLDPLGERRRIQGNAALGRPSDDGVTPEIKRKKSNTMLENLFGN
ncbi:MAG: hypothetical protein ACI82H_000565 [Alphaproteobacteria bacterium]|jgi:hypothetical protein